MPRKAPEKNGHPHRADSRTTDEPTTPIDRVEVLKGTLMQALSQVRELQADLKRQKKQSRLVENALVTLRQLGGQVEAS